VPFITSYGDVVFRFKQVYDADIIFLGYDKMSKKSSWDISKPWRRGQYIALKCQVLIYQRCSIISQKNGILIYTSGNTSELTGVCCSASN